MLAALALASLDDVTCREVAGEAARIHSWLHYWGPPPRPTAIEALAATDRLPVTIRALGLAHCALQAVLVAQPDDAMQLAAEVLGDDALRRTDPLDDVEVQALSAWALAQGVRGRGIDAVAAAEIALPRVAEILLADPVPGNPAGAMPTAFCLGLVLEGRINEATTVAAFIHEGGADVRALRALAGALRARMELYAGRLDSARRFADEALSICRETGQLPASHWPAASFASACAQAGEPAPGEAALDWALDVCYVGPLYEFEARLAQAWLAAARGEVSTARAQALATAEAAATAGMHAFSLFALLDLARFGAPKDAGERLGSIGVKGAYANAVITYVGALTGGDASGLHESSTRFEAMGALLLAAEASANEALVHQARGHHSSKSDAAGRARVLAADCGNPATPALRELTSAPALGLLTDREREVVELAARDLTNREIADRLFVSVRTVNTHLYRSYAKLGLNDRKHLARLMPVDQGGERPK
jgi:DNA-binding CsgD family transcriptional regulator